MIRRTRAYVATSPRTEVRPLLSFPMFASRYFDVNSIATHVDVRTEHGHDVNANQHDSAPRIPFELTIQLPPPLKTGVDYGFLPGTNISRGGLSVGE